VQGKPYDVGPGGAGPASWGVRDTGVFKDADGKGYNVGPGDMTVIRMGQMHGITNNGTAPLVIVAIIAAQQ